MTSKKKLNMLADSPGRAMLLFALPMIMGNLFQQFYTMVDTVVVGRHVGMEELASVGISYSVTNVFIAVAIGGGIGSSVVVSQFLGAGQKGKMKTAISTTLINFLVIGILLGIFGFFMCGHILTWMNTPEEVFRDAYVYLGIYFLGLPFLFMYNVQSAIFNSLGDSKTPLTLLIFSSLLNIALDLVFVLVFHMQVAGVAAATLIAQGVSAVISFAVLLKRLKTYTSTEEFRFYDPGMIFTMIKVALPSTLQQSIVHIGMLLVQSVVNSFHSSSIIAGYAAGTRIESICIVPMLAMGNAMSTFTAQNMGAGQPERVKKGYQAGCAMVGGIAVVLCLLSLLFGDYFVQAFIKSGDGQAAFETGIGYVKFIAFFYACIGLKSVTDGLLRGAGDVLVFTLANLLNLSIRVLAAYYLAPVWGVSAVWFAIPMGWSANFFVSFIRYLTGRWKQITLIQAQEDVKISQT